MNDDFRMLLAAFGSWLMVLVAPPLLFLSTSKVLGAVMAAWNSADMWLKFHDPEGLAGGIGLLACTACFILLMEAQWRVLVPALLKKA